MSLIFAAGCSSGAGDAASTSKNITFGALYPLSGPSSAFGIQQLNGLKIAVKMVNARGGIDGKQIKLEVADAKDAPAASSGAQKLVRDGVPLIFGSGSSGLSLAASPVAERAKVPYVETTGLNHALVQRGYKYYFRVRDENLIYSAAAVKATKDFIAPQLGKDFADLKVAVLYENGPFGSEYKSLVPEEAKAAGGPNVVSEDAYSATDTKDFSAIINKYKSLKPDVIYWAAFASDAALFWHQAQRLNYVPPATVAFASGPGTPEFLDSVGPKVSNGIGVLDVPLSANAADVKPDVAKVLEEFKSNYKSQFPDEPLTGNAVAGFVAGWAVMKDVLGAAKASSLTRNGVQAAMRGADVPLGDLPNGWGLKFDDGGQNERAFPALFEWQGGALTALWPKNLATGNSKYLPIPGSK